MSGISTHVLNTSTGRPAAGVSLMLAMDRGGWVQVATGVTDQDGRCRLTERVEPATYQLRFATGAYFAGRGEAAFYPEVVIVFEATEAKYHVPLLLNPFGYTTYRGT